MTTEERVEEILNLIDQKYNEIDKLMDEVMENHDELPEYLYYDCQNEYDRFIKYVEKCIIQLFSYYYKNEECEIITKIRRFLLNQQDQHHHNDNSVFNSSVDYIIRVIMDNYETRDYLEVYRDEIESGSDSDFTDKYLDKIQKYLI